jgi:hypothetical protein
MSYCMFNFVIVKIGFDGIHFVNAIKCDLNMK